VTATDESPRPVLRVVRGEPTAEELAALVTVLAARAAAGGGDRPARRRPLWRDRTALLGAPRMPGPGSWRASGLPTR
jgi:Acyl-CoA carboxylase epsilon subunit